MIAKIAPAALAAALIAPAAPADEFYVGSEETAAKMTEDSSPDVIVGVLVDEDETFYHLRVEGGEMQLAKSLVYKVVEDDLTVARIEEAEAAAAERLAQANEERHQILAASARRIEQLQARAAEASARRAEEEAAGAAVTDAAYVPAPLPSYDPVVDAYGYPVVDPGPSLFELEALYEEQPSPELARLMRMRRRMR